MKKLFLVGAVALCGVVNAQQNSVKVNPFALLGGGADMVSYERAIGANSSVGIGAGIGGFKFGGVKYKNAGASAFYRYYFNEALQGWYGTGVLSYGGGKVEGRSYSYYDGETSTTSEVKYGVFGFGARAGYQWIWNSGFTLDLNAGINYASFDYKSKADNQQAALKGNGILPAIGIALGYSF